MFSTTSAQQNINFYELASMRLNRSSLFFLLLNCCFSFSVLHAQNKKSIQAVRIQSPPEIDGKLDDACWQEGVVFSDFIQSFPDFGASVKNRTEVKILYDDDAIYVAAKCFTDPDSIWMQLTQRDDISDNTDLISFNIDTYHDGQNALGFAVSSRNVQEDQKWFLNSSSDQTWDAVWESRVLIAEDGWYAEIKIPYSAIRFPKVKTQDWYVDVYRKCRLNRYGYHSAGFDPKVNGVVSQFQPLTGVTDINPPLRLSLSPYATLYENIFTDHSHQISDNELRFKGGMDLKWGISESFTLDATLIPDFGQVQSDNVVYNLSAFEIQYDENRPFFTEGTELFNKASLFYSRRIGFVSDYYQAHHDSGIYLINAPSASQLINAMKISGRTKKGLGIGIFNGVTGNTYADAMGGDGIKKRVLIDPLSNYNVLVLDQSLKNNSFITFTNTNVIRNAGGRDADVANLFTLLENKKNTYAAYGYVAVSTLLNKFPEADSVNYTNGYLYKVGVQKISGNFTIELSHQGISPKFNENDMGFLTVNNQNTAEAGINYDIYKPFGKYNEFHSNNTLQYNYRNQGGAFEAAYLDGSTFLLTRNYLGYFIYYDAYPFGNHDFYEPRADGNFYSEPAVYELGAGFSTDYRKHFAVDAEGGPAIWNETGRVKYRWKISPRLRIGNRIFLVPSNETHLFYNNEGFVHNSETEIIFGRRNVKEFDNSLTGSYIFNSSMSIGLKFRYYGEKGHYLQFYTLEDNGSLLPSSYNENNDFNFKAWNIDCNFTWWFLPGSEINIVWKNSIMGFDNTSEFTFIEDLNHTFDFPNNNNSIRIRYYLDYQEVKRWMR